MHIVFHMNKTEELLQKNPQSNYMGKGEIQ